MRAFRRRRKSRTVTSSRVLGALVAASVAACARGGPASWRAPDEPAETAAPAAAQTRPVFATRLSPPTYHQDVAPILGRRCVSCHDERGIAPFSLRTYEDAAANAIAISWVVAHGLMPPWPADSSGACGTFRDVRRLSTDERAILTSWADAGAPEGDRASAPAPEVLAEPSFEVDVRLAAPEPFTVEPGEDLYWCWLLDPGVSAESFITAYRVQVDRADVVHHLQLYAFDDEAQERRAWTRDVREPAPGYRCDQAGVGGAARQVGPWTPGERLRRWPEGSGVRLTPGRKMVLQIHYHPSTEPVLDHTAVELELSPAVEREGWMSLVSSTNFELPPREPDVSVVAQNSLTRAEPVLLHGVRIHMHELGSRGRLELVRDDVVRCVLDIPEWDFEWQLLYMLEEPVPIDSRDELRVTCTYDTRSRHEPVQWGPSSSDEMCSGITYVTQR